MCLFLKSTAFWIHLNPVIRVVVRAVSNLDRETFDRPNYLSHPCCCADIPLNYRLHLATAHWWLSTPAMYAPPSGSAEKLPKSMNLDCPRLLSIPSVTQRHSAILIIRPQLPPDFSAFGGRRPQYLGSPTWPGINWTGARSPSIFQNIMRETYSQGHPLSAVADCHPRCLLVLCLAGLSMIVLARNSNEFANRKS